MVQPQLGHIDTFMFDAGQLVLNRLQANDGLLCCTRERYFGVSGKFRLHSTYVRDVVHLKTQLEYLGTLMRTMAYKSHFRDEASTGLATRQCNPKFD